MLQFLILYFKWGYQVGYACFLLKKIRVGHWMLQIVEHQWSVAKAQLVLAYIFLCTKKTEYFKRIGDLKG